MPFVKICGLQTYQEATQALDCGATALGFLIGLTHRAADETDEHTTRSTIARLPAGTETVLVTHLLDIPKIAALAAYAGTTTIQIHDNVPPEGLRLLRRIARGKTLIKAIHVTGRAAIAQAQTYADIADALLLDSRTKTRLGGTGQTHDWSISREVAENTKIPVYLAGGLTPENIATAITAVAPAGVDVNSGVENSAGRKDSARMTDFIATAIKRLGNGNMRAAPHPGATIRNLPETANLS